MVCWCHNLQGYCQGQSATGRYRAATVPPAVGRCRASSQPQAGEDVSEVATTCHEIYWEVETAVDDEEEVRDLNPNGDYLQKDNLIIYVETSKLTFASLYTISQTVGSSFGEWHSMYSTTIPSNTRARRSSRRRRDS